MPPDLRLFERFGGLVDHDTKGHYRGLLDQRLLINRCQTCGHWHHPPLPRCPACASADLHATEVSGHGTVALYTWMHQGPPTPGVDYADPHPVVAVELVEQLGLRYTSAAINVDPSRLRIGLPMQLTWIQRHDTPFPVFTPAGP